MSMMHRSMLQTYARGSDKAVALYQRAFDAALVSAYPNEDGTYMHAELDVYGQILAVAEAEADAPVEAGTTMQFCLDFGEGKEALVRKAYEVLAEGARVLYPLGPCSYSPLMADLIDRFGVRWCIFV